MITVLKKVSHLLPRFSILLLATIFLASCTLDLIDHQVNRLAKQSNRSVIPRDIGPLALQTLQIQSFDADKYEVFAAASDSLQDLGYIIDYSDLDSGFIAASSNDTMGSQDLQHTQITIFI